MSQEEKTDMAEQTARTGRPTVTGTVVSDKMTDTIVVREERLVLHSKYKKHIRRKTKYVAHDAGNTCGMGDVVEITQTRPLSKTKRWRLVKILRRGPQVVTAADVKAAADAAEEGDT